MPLLLGVGPYGRFLRLRSTTRQKELGNLMVVAPTRKGKGLLAVSQLLTWPNSIVLNDIKGELFELTAGYRATLGPVFVLDPRGVGHQYDPLAACQDEDDCRAMAVHLLRKSLHDEPDPFIKRAIKMLTAIFRAGLLERARLLPYAAHLLHIGPEDTAQRLQRISERHGLPPSQNLATRFLDRKLADADFSDRYLQSSWSTLTGDMDAVITEKVLRTVAGSDFTPEDILTGREETIDGKIVRRPVTVYLRFPEQRLHAHAPLIRLIWSSLLDDLTTVHDRRRGRDCKRTLALFEEGGTAPVPGLKRFAATVAGRGISLVVMVQDHNQLESEYGRYDARSIINNMQTQLFYEQSGLETSEYIERRLTKQSVYAHSKTIHENHQTVEGETEQAASLLTVQDISELETDIIGVGPSRKPFRAKRMDWREYPELVARTKIPPPALPELAPIPEIPPLAKNQQTEFFDIDQGY